MIFCIRKSRFIILGICFFLFFCNQKDNGLIQVGSLEISKEELENAYLFNPNLASIPSDEEAFKIILYSLIAQKAFANNLNSDDVNDYFLKRIEKEAVIEQFWQKAILDSIIISEEELYKEYQKKNSVRVTEIYVYDNLKNAIKDSLSANNYQNTFIDSIYYDPLNNLSVRSFELTSGLSKPFQSNNLFFRLKMIKEIPLTVLSLQNYEQQKSSFKKVLKRKKAQEKFDEYSGMINDNFGYEIKIAEMNKFVNNLLENFYSDQLKDKTDPELKTEDRTDIILVNFRNGLSWTGKDILNEVNSAPYPLKFSDKKSFALSLKMSIENIIKDESIYQFAKTQDFINNLEVNDQTRIWRDNRNFKRVLAGIIRNNNSDSINTVINKNLEEIFSKITIRRNRKIEIPEQKRSNMLVLKTHFPERTITPIIQPLYINQKNREYLDSLFTN